MGNPFDLNRDGRWSTPERAFTHYGVDPLMRGEKDGGPSPGGCGCFVTLIAVLLGMVLGLWLL